MATKKTVNGIELDAFTLAFIEAMLWATNDESTEQGGNPMDDNYDESDIAVESLTKIKAECEQFQRENAEDIAAGHAGREHTAEEMAGHDFLLTREGHGSGFWDGDWDDVRDIDGENAGERLTEASKKFGECNAYVGDDGKIYVS